METNTKETDATETTLRASIVEAEHVHDAYYARIFDDMALITCRRFGFGEADTAKRRARVRAKQWCEAQGVLPHNICQD